MVQQHIKQSQVRRLHLDLRDGGDLLRTLHRGLDGRKRNLLVTVQGGPQNVLHAGLGFPGRQLQDLQVLPRGPLVRVLPTQGVIRHAKMAAGKQVFVVPVVGERPRLADQRVNDVPVVDGVLADPRQPRHTLHQDVPVPDRHLLDPNHHVHLLTDQAAVDRVGVPQHLDRAAHTHPDVGQPPGAFHPPGRQRTEDRQLFHKPLLPLRIARCR